MTVQLRPLAVADAAAVQPLAARAFDDLDVRQGRPPRGGTSEVTEYYRRAHEHLVATGSGLGAFDGDALVGAAVSYERAGTWVLALLVVEPGRQSDGTGSTLLREALAGAPPLRLLHSSRDARAMRAYARAGFRLLPALRASGTPRLEGTAPMARDADAAAVNAAGCGHLQGDLDHVVRDGGSVLALADGRRGLAVVHGVPGAPRPGVLTAADDETARDLLRAALRAAADRAGEGGVDVGPLAPQEHWAVDVALEARLELTPCGPVAVAGSPDPLVGPCVPPAVFI